MSFDACAVDHDGSTLDSIALGSQRIVAVHWCEPARVAGLTWLGQLDGREVNIPSDQLAALRQELDALRSMWAADPAVGTATLSTSLGSVLLLDDLVARAHALDRLIGIAAQAVGSVHIG